jgi:hypothetical protein
LHNHLRMNRIALIAASVLTLSFTASVARAEDRTDRWAGAGVGLVLFAGIELAPVVLGVTDLVKRPASKTYGGVELAVGTGAAALNTYLAIEWSRADCPSCNEVVPYFIGAAVLDAAIAAHGAYVLMRDEAPAQLELGRARGTFTPTMVTDGKAAAAGIGLTGTF